MASVDTLEALLVICALGSYCVGIRFLESYWLGATIRLVAAKPRVLFAAILCVTFLGALSVAALLHEPIPRVHDEFGYLLMSDTFASGRITNPTPPLPEFFDTFHVLIHPVYVSKFFAAQGLFLAAGQRISGHPAVGLWLSSALSCAATYWMLQAWVGQTWALLGGFLMVVQFGVYSYWSQTYWGGMAAALGGALFFGGARDTSCWKAL
jgi:hypothetical protein